MKTSPRLSATAVLFLVLGLVVSVEIWGVGAGVRAAQGARRRLDHAGREWRRVMAIEPTPTPENSGRVAEDLGRWRVRFESLRAELVGAGWDEDGSRPDPAPTERSDAYFELADFVERMRGLAARMSVTLREDERFSFAAYRRDAPATEELGRVHRERIMIERLLEIFFEAGPNELLAVQREAPAAATPSLAKASAGIGRRGAIADKSDYFLPDPAWSVRSPGAVSVTAFRLAFTGDTAVLRRALNGLIASEVPAVVCSVEVAPEEVGTGRVAANPDSPETILPRARHCFTVVVEAVELVDGANREG